MEMIMIRGQKRQEIMDSLDKFIDDDSMTRDDIETELKLFIDDIEYALGSALDDMNITDIAEIGKIDDARRTINDLHDSIY